MANPLLSHSAQYNKLLQRVFPSLKKINTEYVNEELPVKTHAEQDATPKVVS